MHDLLMVLCAMMGFAVLVMVTGSVFDVIEERAYRKHIVALNDAITYNRQPVDHTITALIMAELDRRTAMTGEYEDSHAYRVLISRVAFIIHKLIDLDVRNQQLIVAVVAEQLNQHSDYTARINMTTNNRIELIVQTVENNRLIYIRFHSLEFLF